jgi:hypothetical protein
MISILVDVAILAIMPLFWVWILTGLIMGATRVACMIAYIKTGSGSPFASERVPKFWAALTRVDQETFIAGGPGAIIVTINAYHQHNWLTVLFGLILLYIWCRDWDYEDRWKRRGKRALQAVRRQGAKLVVVPQAAS